jgi:histidinol-phosphate aminotransferase
MPKTGLRVAQRPNLEADGGIPVAQHIRGIQPYVAVSSLEAMRSEPERESFKIDWNEATVPPSPAVSKAITEFLSNSHHLNLYPVLNSQNLIGCLADYHGLSQEQFLVTNGSDDALNTLCSTYLDVDDRVLVVSPTYQHFLVFVQSRGATVEHFYGLDPFQPDIDGLIEKAAQVRPRMIYLANPNNPTGVMYSVDAIKLLLEANPTALVIVDEAYSEFAGQSARQLLYTYSNLVITRTFSKAFGMAGLRIGYTMADAQVISNLRRLFNPKNVNALAQVGAMAALEDTDWLAWYLSEVEQSKALITRWFADRNIECRMTPANFCMVRFERAPWVVRSLREEGVYVRDRSSMPGLAGFVRYSIGTVAQTEEILRRTGSVLERMRR